MTAPINLCSDTATATLSIDARRPTPDALPWRGPRCLQAVGAGVCAALVGAQCAADMLSASDHPSGHCRGPTDGWLARERGLR